MNMSIFCVNVNAIEGALRCRERSYTALVPAMVPVKVPAKVPANVDVLKELDHI